MLFHKHFSWTQLLLLFLSDPGLLQSFELACSMARSDIHWWMLLVFRKNAFLCLFTAKFNSDNQRLVCTHLFSYGFQEILLLKGVGEQSWISECLLLKLTVWFSTLTVCIWLTAMTTCITFQIPWKSLAISLIHIRTHISMYKFPTCINTLN